MDIDKKDQFDFIFKDVKKVLVVMAHPTIWKLFAEELSPALPQRDEGYDLW